MVVFVNRGLLLVTLKLLYFEFKVKKKTFNWRVCIKRIPRSGFENPDPLSQKIPHKKLSMNIWLFWAGPPLKRFAMKSYV
jgi:hypothetical protein